MNFWGNCIKFIFSFLNIRMDLYFDLLSCFISFKNLFCVDLLIAERDQYHSLLFFAQNLTSHNFKHYFEAILEPVELFVQLQLYSALWTYQFVLLQLETLVHFACQKVSFQWVILLSQVIQSAIQWESALDNRSISKLDIELTLCMLFSLIIKQYFVLLQLINMDQQISLPPFSLYNVGNDNAKTCFESQNLSVLCNIIGPYFQRNKITIDPIVNCNIQGSNFSEDSVCYLNRKIKEIVGLVIVKDKYLRMNFDINFHIVEMSNQEELLPALINLLCFSMMLNGIQIKSVFSCSQIWIKDEKVTWRNPIKSEEKSETKKMCLALQSSQKQIIYSQFDGQFAFVHFQRLSNLLMDANEQIHSYIIKKVGQINDQCQN